MKRLIAHVLRISLSPRFSGVAAASQILATVLTVSPLVGCWMLNFGIWAMVLALPSVAVDTHAAPFPVLSPSSFSHHIERFNQMENENWTNSVSNARSWDWLRANMPLFECPDADVEELYYFRWWSFRKHLVQTTNGFVLTEFLLPMRHAGAFNTISCAVGHHLDEGRWLHDQQYLNDYTRFWLSGNRGKPQPHFHRFSSCFAVAVYERYLVNQDRKFITALLPALADDYRVWERERQSTNGLFWQYDVQDGMEESISGSRTEKNIRPTINSYMFANAKAIAAIARLAGNSSLEKEFEHKAARLKKLTQEWLWNPAANFFEARRPNGEWSGVREELGFVPWRFNLPDPGYELAWMQLTNDAGFHSSYGITTAERRHPLFRSHGCCRCEWDGPVWPFATSQTLGALANLLRNYSQSYVSNKDYFEAFLAYVRCQRFDGKPYVGEYLDEITGQWLKGHQERSRYYNHSTFADLVITGLAGLTPRDGNRIDLAPLLPPDIWDWFCLDGIPYHGHILTILWDRDGKHYNRGPGFSLIADGRLISRNEQLSPLQAELK